VDVPAYDLAPRPQPHLRRQPARAPDDRRRGQLAGDQPGPDPQRQVAAGELGRPHPRQHRRRVRGRRFRDRGIASEGGADLGRHQRRPAPRHAGRRPDLVERDRARAGTSRVGDGELDRAVAVRRRHRLRRVRPAPGGQPRSLRLQDHRLRPHLQADRRRHREEPALVRARPARGSRAPRPAVPRHRERPLRLVRRRRAVAAAPIGPAARARLRPGRAGAVRRPRGRDLRPRLLDPRRPHSAAAVRGHRAEGGPAPAARGRPTASAPSKRRTRSSAIRSPGSTRPTACPSTTG
jgi:hypothetical protein